MELLLLLLVVSGIPALYGNVGAGCVFIGLSIMIGFDAICGKMK